MSSTQLTCYWGYDPAQMMDNSSNGKDKTEWLIGFVEDDKVAICGCCVRDEQENEQAEHVTEMLPLGYSIVGVYINRVSPAKEDDQTRIVAHPDSSFSSVIVTGCDGEPMKTNYSPLFLEILENRAWIRVIYPFEIPCASSPEERRQLVSTTSYRFLTDHDELLDDSSTLLMESLCAPSLSLDFFINQPFWMTKIASIYGVQSLEVDPRRSGTKERLFRCCCDCLCCLPCTSSYPVFLAALKEYFVKYVERFWMTRETSRIPRHFAPSPLLLTLLQHEGDTVAQLHTQFHVPPTIPAFTPSCAVFYALSCDQLTHLAQQPDILLSPHRELLRGSEVVCRGHYLYFHYLQQCLDDRGWGCAYRSLQTLLSFFVLNHYSSSMVPVIPSIPAIQQTLVSIGDKPASFVNSKGWIGSQEVGYVLQSLFSVECKYITLSKGSDFPKYANRVKDHFCKQGTPIMIGGGVLAYTCLGIQTNSKTNDYQLLILDPHYVGKDDLDVVLHVKQSMEGYKAYCCGWRSIKDVFNTSCFYNICLPQRPYVV